MTVKFLLPLVLVSALALTACGKNEADATPAATPAPVTAPVEAPVAAPAPVETPAMAPATPAAEQAMEAIQAQAATLTDAQKQETIAAARKAAEDSGKAQGLTEEQIKQAADMAETATKQMLGVQ